LNSKYPTLGAHLALGTTAILYGINYFTLKRVFEEGVSNFAILSLRCLVGAIGFVIFHQLVIRAKIPPPKDLLRLALCGLFGVAINQTFFLWGLSETSRVNAAVLMIFAPVFVFAVAALLRYEKITWLKLGGLVLSFMGALGLILSSASQPVNINGTSISGDLMIMVNAASYGIYLVIVRPLVMKYNVFTIVMWIFVFGAIPNILLGMPDLLTTDFGAMSNEAIFGIAFLIVGATFGAYFLNAWAMKKLPSSAVGVYIYVQPVLVTVISAILHMGEVSFLNIQFILLIFAGVYLVTMRRKVKSPAQVEPKM
jgi:drug/metabolite transporter (DMT)-like permease